MNGKDGLSTNEVAKFSGATLRRLQWWDEKGYLKPKRIANKRLYTQEQAELAAKWVRCRRKIRVRFNSKLDRVLREHQGNTVVLHRGDFKMIGDTLVIGAA